MPYLLLCSFAATALLIVIAPGLDTAMVLRTAAVDGRRAGVFAAIGIGLGCLAWGATVSVGLGALLKTLPLAFAIIKWAGAGYLVWLGVKMLRAPAATATLAAATAPATARARPVDALLRALGGNLLNPKVGLFYLTLLPQFVPQGVPVWPWSLLLTGVHVAIAVVWFMVLAAGTATLAHVLQRPAVKRGIDLVTGCVFLGFATELAFASVA